MNYRKKLNPLEIKSSFRLQCNSLLPIAWSTGTARDTRQFVVALTRKYPPRGYILGVLTHTTALDRLWGVDETLTMWF